MQSIVNLNVLYIDDTATIRNVLKKIFEELGVKTVKAASNGRDAWEEIQSAVRERPYNLILCDWNMPELDGLKLVEMLRLHSNPTIRDVRFIMITGNDAKIRQALESGVDNFIAKPFTAQQLKRKLEFVLRFDTVA